MMAGRAMFFAGARLVAAAEKAFEELVARFPETPHVHYAFGSFLVNEQGDRAIEEFKSELKISTRHPLAKLQIAYRVHPPRRVGIGAAVGRAGGDRSAYQFRGAQGVRARCCWRRATWRVPSRNSKRA